MGNKEEKIKRKVIESHIMVKEISFHTINVRNKKFSDSFKKEITFLWVQIDLRPKNDELNEKKCRIIEKWRQEEVEEWEK